MVRYAIDGLMPPFEREDLPMLAAQQQAIGDADFWSLKPLMLSIDAGGARGLHRAPDRVGEAMSAPPVSVASGAKRSANAIRRYAGAADPDAVFLDDILARAAAHRGRMPRHDGPPKRALLFGYAGGACPHRIRRALCGRGCRRRAARASSGAGSAPSRAVRRRGRLLPRAG